MGLKPQKSYFVANCCFGSKFGAMINFIPKMHPSVSLLYGTRPLQRITVGTKKQQIEIPLDVVVDIPEKVDTSASYVGNKYNALPWAEFWTSSSTREISS